MGRLFLVLLWGLVFANLSCAGEWTLTDAHTLRLEGSVKSADIFKFDELFTQDIKTLIVNSGGGDVLAAIPIAERIQKQQVDIVVEGLCASSCANYFFIAAKKKKVGRESLLLFHGGIAPMLENSELLVAGMSDAGVPPAQIDFYLKAWEEGAVKERLLYQKAGVDMTLLDYSHRVTNGDYDFWAPPLTTLQNLGVKDIVEFHYPATDEAMKVLADKIRHNYSRKQSSKREGLSIISGDIKQ